MDENFVEVFINAPIEKCIERDPKGLYKKANAGEIKQFTGISDPYEAPTDAEIEVHTDKEDVEESVALIISRLEEMGKIDTEQNADGFSEDKKSFIAERLELLENL